MKQEIPTVPSSQLKFKSSTINLQDLPFKSDIKEQFQKLSYAKFH